MHPTKFLTVSFIALHASAAIAAPSVSGLVSMMGVKGTCRQLTLGDRDATASCTGTMLNTAYEDGRVGFYFVTRDALAVTFSGMGGQTHPNPDTAIQSVDKIITTKDGLTSEAQATGVCRFTNPFKGPGIVSCKARTGSGEFSAAFETDGKPPKTITP